MDNEELKSKLEKFMEAKIPIHIVLKKKPGGSPIPRFFNGYVVGKKTNDIFIIEERRIGQTYVLLDDIYDISVFTDNTRVLADEFIKENDIKLGEGVMKEEIDIIRNFKVTQETKKAKEEPKTSFK